MGLTYITPPNLPNIKTWMEYNLQTPEPIKRLRRLGVTNEMIVPMIAYLGIDDYMRRVESEICREYGINVSKLQENNKSRKREYVQCRQLFYYIVKKNKQVTVSYLGLRYFQDHATVIHSVKTADALIKTNVGYRNSYNNIIRNLPSYI